MGKTGKLRKREKQQNEKERKREKEQPSREKARTNSHHNVNGTPMLMLSFVAPCCCSLGSLCCNLAWSCMCDIVWLFSETMFQKGVLFIYYFFYLSFFLSHFFPFLSFFFTFFGGRGVLCIPLILIFFMFILITFSIVSFNSLALNADLNLIPQNQQLFTWT